MPSSIRAEAQPLSSEFRSSLLLPRGIDENSFVSRNSVEEVYNQVIADLITAASKLPEENDVYATSGAATALLARVYLQKGDYAKARDAANTVIESGLYELQPSYADVFNNDDNTSEDIFATQITSQDRFSAMTEFFSIPEYGGRDGDIEILDGHLNLYSPGDERLDLFFLGNGGMRSGKWNNLYGVVNLIRLPEMYLIRAECNVRLGTTIGAAPLSDYNTVHKGQALQLPQLSHSMIFCMREDWSSHMKDSGFTTSAGCRKMWGHYPIMIRSCISDSLQGNRS